MCFAAARHGVVTHAGSDSSYVFAAIQYPQDRFDELAAFYADYTSSDGREWNTSQSTSDFSGTTMRTVMYVSGPSAITIADCFTISGDDELAACVTVNESQ